MGGRRVFLGPIIKPDEEEENAGVVLGDRRFDALDCPLFGRAVVRICHLLTNDVGTAPGCEKR